MLEVSFVKTLGKFSLQSAFTSDSGVLGILGPSGCGKSMTLKCIAGLVHPDNGFIKLNGKELYNSVSGIFIPPKMRNIGYVFQNHALFPHLTVYENIAYGICHLPKDDQHRKVTEMLRKTHLIGHEKHYPSQLSGGQQQRVALSRTLITEPELLMLDEPFSALDSHVKSMVEKELLEIIRNDYQGTVVLVTHDVEEAYRICDTIMIMDQGISIQIGDKNQVLQRPTSLSAARITGCRNIFQAECVGEETDSWLIQVGDLLLHAIKVDTVMTSPLKIGLHAHDIFLSKGDALDANAYECTVINVVEGIFYSNVLVNCGGINLEVEVSKKDLLYLFDAESSKLTLHIPPEKVIPLTDGSVQNTNN